MQKEEILEVIESKGDIARRRSRASEGRSHESREGVSRPPLTHVRLSRFNVPEAVTRADPDYHYCYVVYSSGNEEMRDNYDLAVEKGYMAVSAAEHPSLAKRNTLSPFRDKEDDSAQLIKRGGQILMKIRKEDYDAEQAIYDSESARDNYMAQTFRTGDARSLQLDENARFRSKIMH